VSSLFRWKFFPSLSMQGGPNSQPIMRFEEHWWKFRGGGGLNTECMNNQERPPIVNDKRLHHSICQLENIIAFHFMQDGAFFKWCLYMVAWCYLGRMDWEIWHPWMASMDPRLKAFGIFFVGMSQGINSLHKIKKPKRTGGKNNQCSYKHSWKRAVIISSKCANSINNMC
jgi:hypothetical protein